MPDGREAKTLTADLDANLRLGASKQDFYTTSPERIDEEHDRMDLDICNGHPTSMREWAFKYQTSIQTTSVAT